MGIIFIPSPSTPVPIPRGIESNKSTYIFATLASQSARTSRFTPAASNTSASGFLRHYSGSFLTYPCWSSSKQKHTLELTPGQHLEDNVSGVGVGAMGERRGRCSRCSTRQRYGLSSRYCKDKIASTDQEEESNNPAHRRGPPRPVLRSCWSPRWRCVHELCLFLLVFRGATAVDKILDKAWAASRYSGRTGSGRCRRCTCPGIHNSRCSYYNTATNSTQRPQEVILGDRKRGGPQ